MSAPTIDAAAVLADGPSVIRFESRAEFHAARDSHIVTIVNPFLIAVRGAEVRVPVLFGDGNTLWRTVAVYPTQKPCDCNAEVVHQLGCSAREYPDVSMFTEPAPVDPIDWATVAECADCGVLNGSHQSWCWRVSRVDLDAAARIPVVVVDLPRREPGAMTDVHLYVSGGLNACPAGGEVTSVREHVTCPDCLAQTAAGPEVAL